MRVTLCHLGLAFIIVVTGQAQAFSKRGLVYVPSAKYPQDDQFWDSPSSCLTWYYNYADTPSRSYHGSKLDFVPQLWGHPSDKTGTAFLDSVTAQIKDGANITYVLGFNEPDMSSYGGSGIDPSTAAEIWQREIEPLGKLGVKLGSPGCSSSPNGISWMKQFQAACSNCTMDFMAVHFYGSFQGLANHIGEYVGTFNKTVWVTEYGFPHASLKDSQAFYNESSSFMDRNPYVTGLRYPKLEETHSC